MKIQFFYKTLELKGKKSKDGLPLYSDVNKTWEYEARDTFTGVTTHEAIDAFYKWANENKLGVTIRQIRYLDFY